MSSQKAFVRTWVLSVAVKGGHSGFRLKQWARQTWQMSTNVDIMSLTLRWVMHVSYQY